MINRVVLVGRLTRDPELRKTQSGTSVCSFTMAVGRRVSTQGQPDADFINCVVFGKSAEFTERYFRQGMRVVVCGRIQTGSYVNKDGQKVYTTDIIVDDQEFADSKGQGGDNSGFGGGNSYGGGNRGGYQQGTRPAPSSSIGDGFMNITDGVEDEGHAFN